MPENSKSWEALLEDLQPKYICPYLVEKEILTEKDVLNICSNSLPLTRLLEIIQSKGPDAFEGFLTCLNEDDSYPWLHQTAKEYFQSASKAILQKGGVPFPSAFEVERSNAVRKVHDALFIASSKGRHWVVLYGMVGSGKSVLATQALRSFNYLPACFPDGIYWLPIGNVQEEKNNALLLKLQMLCDQFDYNYHPDTLHAAKIYLCNKASIHKKCLLILDDVWHYDVINAFDIGWPVLVTTRDFSILDENKTFTTYIDCGPGFTLVETKKYLSQRLKVTPQELNMAVEKIHNKHLGLPFIISMVGNLMERYNNNDDRWQDVLSKLETGQMKRMRRPSGESTFNQAIKDSVETLKDENYLDYYQDFMIFWDDFYIPCQVFQVMWDMDSFDVEEIMDCFLKKSLLQKIEERHSESGKEKPQLCYGIHDLYLKFLKNEYKSTMKSRHEKLITRYLNLCIKEDGTYNLNKLPDDGYIHTFMAYHLSKANLFHLFPKIFLDLRFIVTKLRLNGPHDLIHDLEANKTHFQEALSAHEDFQLFLRHNGHNLCEPDADVFQLALNELTSSDVYKKAYKLVTDDKLILQKKYLKYCNRESNDTSLLLSTKPHDGTVSCAIFSPCNQFILSCGNDCLIKIWDSHSGKYFMEFRGHKDDVNSCTISTDGSLLASASKDQTVRIWSLERFNKETQKLKSGSDTPKPFSCSFSFDSAVDLQEEATTLIFKLHKSSVLTCAFSHDGSKVASGSEDGDVLLWSISNGDIFLKVDKPCFNITSCCFSPNDCLLATSTSSQVTLWDLTNGKIYSELFHNEQSVASCMFLSNGTSLISAAGQFIWLWNLTDCTLSRKYNSLKDVYLITSCTFSPDERYIFAGTSEGTIAVWDSLSQYIHAAFKGHSERLVFLNVSNDSSKLVSSCNDGTVMIWDIASHFKSTNLVCLTQEFSVQFSQEGIPTVVAVNESDQLLIMNGLEGKRIFQSEKLSDVTACCLSPDSKLIVFGDQSGVVQLLDYSSGKMSFVWQHKGAVCCCLFLSENDSFLTGASTGEIKLWCDGKISTLLGHKDFVQKCIPYIVDGQQRLLSCSYDGTIKSWDLNSLTNLVTCSHRTQTITSCDVSRDSQYFASSSVDKTTKLWNANTGDLIHSFEFTSCCRSVKFSPCGLQLAVGTDSGLIKLLNLRNNSSRDLNRHQGFVYEMIFSSSGKELVSVGDEICFWKTADPVASKTLQTFSVQGKRIKSIYVSNKFDTFVTIDANGTLYILKQLDSL